MLTILFASTGCVVYVLGASIATLVAGYFVAIFGLAKKCLPCSILLILLTGLLWPAVWIAGMSFAAVLLTAVAYRRFTGKPA